MKHGQGILLHSHAHSMCAWLAAEALLHPVAVPDLAKGGRVNQVDFLVLALAREEHTGDAVGPAVVIAQVLLQLQAGAPDHSSQAAAREQAAQYAMCCCNSIAIVLTQRRFATSVMVAAACCANRGESASRQGFVLASAKKEPAAMLRRSNDCT